MCKGEERAICIYMGKWLKDKKTSDAERQRDRGRGSEGKSKAEKWSEGDKGRKRWETRDGLIRGFGSSCTQAPPVAF
jgi:hypothetical protein